MNNYLEWDKSYSSERRLAKWEREENKRILWSITVVAGIWFCLFNLFLRIL